ncbi:ABC transporter permease subunit [Pelagibacteraceae bacterium]|nr:ABC transporter permease subunit [Pelagibacteraceae bacterium]
MFEVFAFGSSGWGDEMLMGALMTVLVSASSLILGIVIGIIFAACKLSNIFVLKVIANIYTTIIRGIPELLVIYLLFFGGSGAVMYLAKIFGYNGYIELNAFTIGTIAVGAISGAYSTEVIRGAVNSVQKGQFEAGKTLGLNGYGLYGKIIFPQVARIALPGIGNVWQITLKDTALISVTGLVEIMRQSRIAAGSTHEPFIFYTAAIILYLLITRFSNILFDKAENNYSKGFVSKEAL